MKLFVYGTLIFDEILSELLKRKFVSAPGLLENYEMKKFLNAEYPGIIAEKNSRVSGKIIFNINAQDIAILDAYEGVMYKRRILKVKTNSKEYDCQVYIVKGKYRKKLSEDPWCPLGFRNNSLNSYVMNLN